jgi:hypothetical protein
MGATAAERERQEARARGTCVPPRAGRRGQGAAVERREHQGSSCGRSGPALATAVKYGSGSGSDSGDGGNGGGRHGVAAAARRGALGVQIVAASPGSLR